MSNNLLTFNYLSINEDIILTHKKDFLIYLLAYNIFNTNLTANSKDNINTYRCHAATHIGKSIRLNAQTVRRYLRTYSYAEKAYYQVSGDVFAQLLRDSSAMAAAEQNTLMRIFFFVFCQVCGFGHYSNSVKNIAAILGYKETVVSAHLQFLLDRRFLVLHHDYLHGAFCRSYGLYKDQVVHCSATARRYLIERNCEKILDKKSNS